VRITGGVTVIGAVAPPYTRRVLWYSHLVLSVPP